jgi:cyclophilin family peptidyl-prolyl cis-trans isomerase
VVVIETSVGDITVELDAAKAPISVENFLGYVKDGFYSGTIFHRVIKDFMIQGGGMTADGQPKKTKASIRNEAANGLKNTRHHRRQHARVNGATSRSSSHRRQRLLDHRASTKDFGCLRQGDSRHGRRRQDPQCADQPGDFPVDQW